MVVPSGDVTHTEKGNFFKWKIVNSYERRKLSPRSFMCLPSARFSLVDLFFVLFVTP